MAMSWSGCVRAIMQPALRRNAQSGAPAPTFRRLEQLSGHNRRRLGLSPSLRSVSPVAVLEPKIAKHDDTRINDEITATRCRLIGVDGSQLGLFGIRDAQRVADEQGLDLVEIAPNADPPVCRVMDYGKFKYQQAMKAKQARKNQSRVEVKEMKFRPKIDVGDYETKKGHVLRFLKKGARVKVTIMFRGREMAHPEQGLNVLERLAEDLKPYATVESQPKLEGRNMLMLLAPIKGAFDEKPEKSDSKEN